MKRRCYNQNCPAYPDYGGRGIIVCDRWHDFVLFFEDMGEPPEGKTLDRIDNDLGYFKDNCRWASRLIQARNRRGRHLLTAFGETKTMAEWADESGISISTLQARVSKYGWSHEKAIRTPIRVTGRWPKSEPVDVPGWLQDRVPA